MAASPEEPAGDDRSAPSPSDANGSGGLSFGSVFLAVVVATALVVAAFLLHQQRPEREAGRATPELVRATGECAACHRRETGAIVREFERSRHAEAGTNCLDCHRPRPGQDTAAHRGFDITSEVTAANCQACHAEPYRQFARSRHAAPAYAAVMGAEPFTEEQIAHAEEYHPGAVDRPPNRLAELEGEAAREAGCISCHSIGRPNEDGSIGQCTACHARHQTSIRLARMPRTCGQCHMGPDHSQLEIYRESKHGVIFSSLREQMNLDAAPDRLTVDDMPVPTCSTCHMSGLEGAGVTHDVTERLSWFLFAPVSERRETYTQGQDAMKGICNTCHTAEHTEEFYELAEEVVASTNEKVGEARALMDSLRDEGHLTPEPYDETLEITYFDMWHYYGRTAKHGAFMGGADYVQWHGNYELLTHMVELRERARELRGSESGSE